MRKLSRRMLKKVTGDLAESHYETVDLSTGEVSARVPELDGGAVIAQAVLTVAANEAEQSLIQRVHKLEHIIYPLVLNWLSYGRLSYQQGLPVLDGQTLSTPMKLLFD